MKRLLKERHNLDWLDQIISEQQDQVSILDRICDPFIPTELQEQAERENFEEVTEC